MRTFNLLKIVSAIALTMGFASAQAATLTGNIGTGIGGTVPVTAVVAATCTFATNGPLPFTGYTSGQPTDINVQTSVTANCSNLAPYSIAMGPGLYEGGAWAGTRALKEAASANYLAYNIYTDAARTNAWGDNVWNGATLSGLIGNGGNQVYVVYGQIPRSQTVAAGTYSDTVVATITY